MADSIFSFYGCDPGCRMYNEKEAAGLAAHQHVILQLLVATAGWNMT